MKRVTLPAAKSRGNPRDMSSKPWGLVEFILEWILTLPENFGAIANLLLLQSLSSKFERLREKQNGTETVLLTDEEHEFLVQRFPVALQRFASQGRNPDQIPAVAAHLVHDMAEYSKALLGAEHTGGAA